MCIRDRFTMSLLPSTGSAEAQRQALASQNQLLRSHSSGMSPRSERLEDTLQNCVLVRPAPAAPADENSKQLRRLHTRQTLRMAEAALKAHVGDRDANEMGYESMLASVRGNLVTFFVEECYCTWTIEYRVGLNGTAEEVEGSRSEEDCGKPDSGPEFDTPVLDRYGCSMIV
eukprot:TRINITY_DN20958_c0_g1_i1.p1 TRINITY_DN20958_c0_g1~~TRINITY_DN20958_c0_g1_i1.p1  ORF type:complete len:172 (+),score=34.26 TRINITY_DN20958_c0_g1_i1:79-594(+)